MATIKVDLIVLGATGFTGKHVVKKLCQLTEGPDYKDLTWAVAGRSQEKLDQLLLELQTLGFNNTSRIPVVKCDIYDGRLLNMACQRASILINCTGPNIVLSEPIVKACIENKTHYVDISAELMHMLHIYRTFHKEATEKKILIISACGFGSIPTLIGLAHLENKFPGKLHSVECYVALDIPKEALIPGRNNCLLHFGTWECFVHELRNYPRYRELKRQTFTEPAPVPMDIERSFFHKKNGKCWVPYPGPDADIVQMTQQYLFEKEKKRPYHFKCYTTMPSWYHFIILVPIFFIAYWLCYFKCFAQLLIKNPRIFSLGYFSHKGPTEEMMNGLKYSFTLKGRGWSDEAQDSQPNKTMTLKISGSDPGYKTTATTLVFSAITILKESDKIPKGGVITTGSAFCNTTMADKLNEHGIQFEIK